MNRIIRMNRINRSSALYYPASLAGPRMVQAALFWLYVICAVIAAFNFGLFCASCRALWRVLRAAARDAYSSPRRRLLALDEDGARRRPSRVMAVLGASRPWTTQKALLAMVVLTAARELIAQHRAASIPCYYCISVVVDRLDIWLALRCRGVGSRFSRRVIAFKRLTPSAHRVDDMTICCHACDKQMRAIVRCRCGRSFVRTVL